MPVVPAADVTDVGVLSLHSASVTALDLDGDGILNPFMGACGPSIERAGRPVSLPAGRPTNACEREDWLELVAARGEAQGTTGVGQFYVGIRSANHVLERPKDGK